MNLFKTVVTISILFCMSFNAYAKTDCETPETAADQRDCNGQEFVRLEMELNIVWKKIIAKIPADSTTDDKRKERQQFIAAQKAWLKYRDEDCAAVGGQQGGSNLWVTIFAQQCQNGMTAERIKFLKEVAQ